MRASLIKNILVNIRAFFTTNIRKQLNENTAKIARLEEIVDSLDQTISTKFHYLNLLDYYARHQEEAGPYQKELNYLKQHGEYCCFPYKTTPSPVHIEFGFDPESQLPYVVHDNKKIFFKANQSPTEALESYKYYLQTERLLGDTEAEDTPHQYQSPCVHVVEGDVVFDIGAAEGLFALDNIDKASHVVIVESDPEWIKPLKQTFASYGDKVTIIQKFVSATNTETTISLEKILSSVDYKSAFVKMDIEGYELQSLSSADCVLRQKKGTKLAVASYHKQHDAEEMKYFFDNIGYNSEFSKGYMLFHLYDTPMPPYFRKGIIRAKSI